MIKGLIFDIDGVIINTENLHFLSFKKILEKHGYDLSFEKYKQHFSGKSIEGGILSLLSEKDIADKGNQDSFIELVTTEKIEETMDLFRKELIFFDDTISFIDKIKNGDIELQDIGYIEADPILAMTTGLEAVLLDEVLRRHNLKEIFSVVVTADQYTHSKPNPECYIKTLEQMQLDSQMVIGIEDTPSGIKALNAANILSVGITNTHLESELHEAKVVTDTLLGLVTGTH